MAKGDRGSRGRGEYGGGSHDRGTSRRDGRGGFGGDRGGDSRRERQERNQRQERERREKRERDKKERDKKEREARDAAERERYESAGEASNPDAGHSGSWRDAPEYKDRDSARRGEQARRDREKRERAQNRMRQREAFRRQKAADRASGGLGGTTEYGRNITDAEIDRQMETDAYDRAANDAWNAGNYGSWLGNSLAGAATGFTNNVATEFNDFTSAPLDYVSDVARNPFVGAALAVVSPPMALGAAGVKVADSITDYFQGEATMEQALRQGALDVAGSIQNQGLATMAQFVGDPTGTTSQQLGQGLGMAVGGGLAGAALGALAPGVIGGALDDLSAADANLSPKERREIRETAQKQREDRESGRGSDTEVSLGGGSGGVNLGGDTVSTSGGGRMYSPGQGWQMDMMSMYGMEQLPSTTPSSSTKGLTSGKIGNKAGRALSLVEQYPWMFDQGVLSSGRNPYAVTT